MRILVALAAMVALAGCIYISDNSIPGDFDDEASAAERLYGVTVEPAGVRVVVASNGCTSEESFDVDVDPFRSNGSQRYLVRFSRFEPDRCRAFLPDGVELFFSRERLGLAPDAPISISNRIGR